MDDGVLNCEELVRDLRPNIKNQFAEVVVRKNTCMLIDVTDRRTAVSLLGVSKVMLHFKPVSLYKRELYCINEDFGRARAICESPTR